MTARRRLLWLLALLAVILAGLFVYPAVKDMRNAELDPDCVGSRPACDYRQPR